MYDSANTNGASIPAQPSADIAGLSRNIAGHLGELRGLAQLLVYLADQIEETDNRLESAQDPTQVAFLNRVLNMYSSELEKRHQGLSGRISAISSEVATKIKPIQAR